MKRESIKLPKGFVIENKKEVGVDCPDCGMSLRIRVNNENGNFFAGCSGYPDCRYATGVRETDERQMELAF